MRSFLNHYKFNLELLPTREEVEGMKPTLRESVKDFAYRWKLKTSNLKHPMSEEDLISTFMRMLGLTYQLMFITASQNNYAEIDDKADKVELTIRAGLIHEESLALVSSSKTVAKKAVATRLEANLVHAIKIPHPSQNSGHVLLLPQLAQTYPTAMNIIPPQAQ